MARDILQLEEHLQLPGTHPACRRAERKNQASWGCYLLVDALLKVERKHHRENLGGAVFTSHGFFFYKLLFFYIINVFKGIRTKVSPARFYGSS
jgi:hypothetical protein